MKSLFLGGLLITVTLAHGCQQVEQQPANTVAADRSTIAVKSKPRSGQSIHWFKSMDAALSEAKRTKKPIMVDFYADWCGPCRILDTKIYTDELVIERSRQWVAVKINVDKNQKVAVKYQVNALPTIAFLKSDGSLIKGFKGVPKASRLAEVMEALLQEAHTT